MPMGFKDDGDPPTGNPGVVEDSVEYGMDMKEITKFGLVPPNLSLPVITR
jgi:hypothetical protein